MANPLPVLGIFALYAGMRVEFQLKRLRGKST